MKESLLAVLNELLFFYSLLYYLLRTPVTY
jgi:hypothetical protein